MMAAGGESKRRAIEAALSKSGSPTKGVSQKMEEMKLDEGPSSPGKQGGQYAEDVGQGDRLTAAKAEAQKQRMRK